MTTPDERPDPDALLRRVQVEEGRRAGSALKIFFGYAPGIGKTYTMLESARRLRDAGVDVVVGCAETHGRAETAALLAGLEVLPRRDVAYRGTTLAEFDLDRALARRPAVLLVDELAHDNAPGSRHRKRWQDVLELLEQGIDVHTTLNVQHVESLNDVVSQITYVRVRETVPDSILERADEIEVVDLPPDELLERLRAGKVYIPEQARQAVDHFFRRGNLLALRELSLRRVAERIDADVRAYRHDYDIKATWPAAEHILVCVGPSPSSSRIIRGARRMAEGLRARWTAVYAEASDAFPMSPADEERLQGHLLLAESLGAEVVRLSGRRLADVLIDHAREHNVTRIVVGKPTHSRWRDRFTGSLVSRIVRGSGDIEVHFIAGDEAPDRPADGRARAPRRFDGKGYGVAALSVLAATAVGVLARDYLSQPDFVMMFLLTIMVAAYRYGRGPSLAAAGLAVAAYDFFFVPPFHTFSVEHARHLLTFLMMFAVGLVISGLTSRLRRQEHGARRRESRTAALYSLSRELASAQGAAQVARVTAAHAAAVFGGGAVVLTADAAGSLKEGGEGAAGLELSEEEFAVARWSAEHGRPAGGGTDTLPGSRVTCYPLRAGADTLGALAVATPSREMLAVEQRGFIEAFVRQAALAFERVRLVEEARVAALRARTEETRSALLGAVSHDLRTPLGAIVGAGSTLRDESGRLAPAQRQELCDTICSEAERMERLVANILDMVRLESGGIVPKREWVPLEETVGSALSRLEARLGARAVRLDLPPQLPLLSVDPVLFEQVFINLIENVIKHGGPDTPLEIAARAAGATLEIEVADRGPGLPAGAGEQVFEKFYRGPEVRTGGVGLGLAICRGIVHAHGGTIAAANREGGGAVFRIAMPLQEAPPAVAPASEAETPERGREP
ncbi:MAG: sensor histidine kinase KdpD [bacterium]|nr:sensor histidine kinase KdpD [bacterium]